MKRKVLLRVLSLLIAGTLVLESPAQAFAAQVAQVPATVEAEAESGSAEEVPEENMEQPADDAEQAADETETPADETEQPSEDTEAPSEDAEQPAEEPEAPTDDTEVPAEDAEQPTDGTETPAETPDETETPAEDTEADVTEQPAEIPDETDAAVDEVPMPDNAATSAETRAVKTDEITVKGPQFGTAADADSIISASEASTYSAAISKLTEGMKNAETYVSLSELETPVRVTMLEPILNYLLEQDTYEKLLPQVEYTYDSESAEVQMVILNYAKSSISLSVQSRTASSTVLTMNGTVSGATSYELWRRDETQKSVEKVSASVSGTAVTDSNAGIHNYTYILYAKNSSGEYIAYSNLATSNYTLAAPAGLTAVLNNPESATLTWNASSTVNNYTIYRNGTVVATPGGDWTSWTDPNVKAGVTYTYRLVAYTGSYNQYQSEASVSLKWDKGLSITNASASSDRGDQMTLSWDAVYGAAGYKIYRKNGSSYQLVLDTAGNKPLITGLDPAVNYQFVVIPYRRSGSETIYGNVSSTISARTKLAKVTLKAESASYSSIKLTWNERAGASGYNIYRRTSNSSYTLVKRISTGSTTSWTNSKLSFNKKYYFKIVPFKTTSAGDLEGVESKTVNATTKLPKASLSSVTGTSYNTIKVTWQKVSGAQGYELYRSTSSGSGYKLAKRITSGSKVSYSNSGLSIGRTYYYKVRAYRTVNGKRVYGSWSKVMKGQTVLDQVKSLKVTVQDYTTMKLTWKKADKADKYQIYYSTSKNGTYQKLATVSDTEYTWKKPTCGQTYYFKVRAMKTVSGRTGYGTYSAIVSKKTTIVKPSPKIQKITYNSVTLEWEKVDGAQKYEIYGSTSKDGTYVSLGTTTKTTFTHKDLALEKTYYYKVRSIRQKYTSGFSSVKTATTKLGKLTGLKVEKYYDGDLKISWDEVDGATSYQIYRSTDENDEEEYKRIASVTGKSFIDTNVSSSKTYYYKVYGIRGEYRTDDMDAVSVKNSAERKGIDVSSYQGTIDWKKVANDGIDFAMIRIVTGSSSSTTRDVNFVDNYDGARNNGIKVGVYRYSYATSRTKAREEAENVIDALNGRKLDYPIVMDMEDDSILSGTDSNSRRSEIILAFKEVVEDAGYDFALYASKTWLDNYLDMDDLEDVDIWIARWRDFDSGHGYTGKGNVTMWQYSSSGSVDGISGKVDLNVSYKDY